MYYVSRIKVFFIYFLTYHFLRIFIWIGIAPCSILNGTFLSLLIWILSKLCKQVHKKSVSIKVDTGLSSSPLHAKVLLGVGIHVVSRLLFFRFAHFHQVGQNCKDCQQFLKYENSKWNLILNIFGILWSDPGEKIPVFTEKPKLPTFS